jgi:hypothetical protein
VKLSPFPPGWVVGFLVNDASADGGDLEVGFVPIVGMEASEEEGLHAIVMAPSGELVRVKDVEHPLICVVGPEEDRQRVAKAGLRVRAARLATAKPGTATVKA